MGPPETTIWEYPFPDRSWDLEFEDFARAVAEKRRPCGEHLRREGQPRYRQGHLLGKTWMIIIRSPLRITLGGGGTDLPSYYSGHGGFLIAGAIDRYVYITLHETFGDDMTSSTQASSASPRRAS